MSEQIRIAELVMERMDDRKGFDAESLSDYLFVNHRSLRLTRRGFEMIRGYFECFEVDISGRIVSNRHILYLDRNLQSPWYIGRVHGRHHLVLFDGKTALELKLRDGNFDSLLRWRHSFT